MRSRESRVSLARLDPRVWLAVPAVFWLLLFLVLPMGVVLCISFLSAGVYGEVELPLTLENYRRFFGFGLLGFDPVYPLIVLRSVLLGLGTTFCCILAGIPMAFFIAGLPGRWKGPALMLAVIPIWINLLVRTYAWQILLSSQSWPARLAASLGWMNAGEALYPSLFAVYAGMVCDFLPYFILPLYVSVEKMDRGLAEAAMDLGAGRWSAFRHGVLPQIKPGLIAGALLVFLPATGQFVVPDLLGGAKTVFIGGAVQHQFGSARDWPFGSAIALMVLAMVLGCLWVYAKAGARGEEV